MKKYLLIASLFLFNFTIFGQAGHVMQGVGAVNMSMGGAATGQPLDIYGAMYWNPAGLSKFSGREVSLSVGAFFSSLELSSSFGRFSGTTLDDIDASIMPALAFVYGNPDSKHTFGFSAFGISGFGVTFPEDTNYPQDALVNPNPNYNPNLGSNPINFPQNPGGCGRMESGYILLQIGLTYAYEITPEFSVGIQPDLDYAALELAPNPIASPDFPPPMGTGKGDQTANKALAIGFGGQLGVFYDSGDLLKFGASYKSKQYFSEFDFDQTYLDGCTDSNVQFKMNYPAIYSVGLGL
jgi:long-chain fatty acid transport protein